MLRLILRNQSDRDKACSAVAGASLEPPSEVIMQPWKKKLSREAQNRHFAILRMIEVRVSDENGVHHSYMVWHSFFSALFIGSQIIKIGGRETVVPLHSSDLSSGEFAEFDDKIVAWVASEVGVVLVLETDG